MMTGSTQSRIELNPLYAILILLIFSLLFFADNASAAVYKGRDAQGNVRYSDKPFPGAKRIRLPPSSVVRRGRNQPYPRQPQNLPPRNGQPGILEPVPAPPLERLPANLPKATVRFNNIENEQTFQNQRIIPVNFDLSRDLLPGERVDLIVDGKLYASSSGTTQLFLENLPRGSHQIQLQIVAPNGQVIFKSRVLTIFIHLARVGERKKALPLTIKAAELKPAEEVDKDKDEGKDNDNSNDENNDQPADNDETQNES